MSDIEDYLDDVDYLYWEEEPIDSMVRFSIAGRSTVLAR